MEQKKLSTGWAIVIAGGLIAGAVLITGSNLFVPKTQEKAGTEDTITLARLITNDDHYKGSPDARFVLVEFSDLECPFCKTYHNEINKALLALPDDLAVVFRQFPIQTLHAQAFDEAVASECIARLGNDALFWQYLDRIFETTTSNDGLDLALLPVFAEELGIDRTLFTACTENPDIRTLVEEDVDEAKKIGVRGTPGTIIIDTKTNKSVASFIGAKSSDAIVTIIEGLK